MTTKTTAIATVARVGALGMLVGVLLFAALLGAAQPASAAPVTTSSSGWNKANFRSSCEAAGGKSREITQTNPETGQVDVDYSYCTWPDGGRNQCDWIKKTCTFGIRADHPQGLRGTVGGTVGGQATTNGGSGSGSTLQVATHVVPIGGLVVLPDDDDRP